jgi:hypothetical protein
MDGVSQKGVALYGVRLSPRRGMVIIVEIVHPCDAKVISYTPVEWHRNRACKLWVIWTIFTTISRNIFLFLLRLIEITTHMNNNKVPKQKKAAAT